MIETKGPCVWNTSQSQHTRFLKNIRKLHLRLLPLMDAMFAESNPIPVKASLAMLGLCSWEIRLPMTPLSESLRPRLKQIMAESGIAGVDP